MCVKIKMDSVEELLRFLQIGARFDLKIIALQHILGLTATEDSLNEIIKMPQLLTSLISLLDDNSETIGKDAALSLVNISASEQGANALISLEINSDNCPPLTTAPENIVVTTFRLVCNENSKLADCCCMILSNLCRPIYLNDKVTEILLENKANFNKLIDISTNTAYNKCECNLHYSGALLANLSQNHQIRKLILNSQNKTVLEKLMAFIEYPNSIIRRNGIVSVLKNCCFELDSHEFLLSKEIDILSKLILPLAAGTEELDDDDTEKLPLDLQYLPQDKEREIDPEIRCMLLEAVTQLCTKRKQRELIRNCNIYVILRELHKCETNRKVMLLLENLIDILIRTEAEIGQDNLKTIDVPQDLQEKFRKSDEDYLNERTETENTI